MIPIARRPKPTRQLPPADVDRLADEIAEVSSHIDAATHRLLTLIRRFDEGGGWAVHDALSCAHWLSWRVGLEPGAARERVRVARALGSLPVLDDALRRGIVSYSKVRAMTRVAAAGTEATLLEMARDATASQLERICRGYRRALGGAGERPESLGDEEHRRFVRVRDTEDGMVCIEARLRPEEAAVVLRALDAARRRAWRSGDGERQSVGGGTTARTCDHVRAEPGAGSAYGGDAASPHAGRLPAAPDGVSAETPRAASGTACDASAETSPHGITSAGPRPAHEPRPLLARADALVAVAEEYLRGPTSPRDAATGAGAGATPVELVVHVGEAALRADAIDTRGTPRTEPCGTLDDGTALPVPTAQRLACDATVLRVAAGGEGSLRPLGRRTRRISSTLRRALRLRDDACRFPGCTNRITDAHHVVPWSRGGATRIDNLCSLCRRHHRLVHEHGYRIETRAGDGLRFVRRDGSVVPAAGVPRAPLQDDAVARLEQIHAANGVRIDAQTAFPRWDGTPVDYGLAVEALLDRDAPVGANLECACTPLARTGKDVRHDAGRPERGR